MHTTRDLTIRRRDGNENVKTNKQTNKQTIGLEGKTTNLHVHHTFLYIPLPFLHDYVVKFPNWTHLSDDEILFLSLNLDRDPRNLTPGGFTHF